jgi:hypothetical protein
MADKFVWQWSSSIQYSTKSTYRLLHHGLIQFEAADCIWKNRAPLKYQIYMWLMLQYSIWMSEHRFRHGLRDQ